MRLDIGVGEGELRVLEDGGDRRIPLDDIEGEGGLDHEIRISVTGRLGQAEPEVFADTGNFYR